MICTVTGNAKDLQLQALNGVKITFIKAVDGVRTGQDEVRLPDPVSVETDASGDFSIDILPGSYRVTFWTQGHRHETTCVIPEAATANLQDIITASLPDDVDAATQSVLDAQSLRGVVAALAAQTDLDRIATGEDAEATALDRTATDEDATATAADRVATGQNATATAADRIATGQDRTATGEDATATAADRVATGQDRVATGLDRTAVAADAAAALAFQQAAAQNEAIATAQTGVAVTKAGEAAASATYAGEQAGIALTKAGEASTSEGVATTKAAEASASETVATTKAGDAAVSASQAAASEVDALAHKNIAQTEANRAKTEADNAAAQAGIATTKAGEANTSEAAALAYKDNAQTEADRAQTEADNAAANSSGQNMAGYETDIGSANNAFYIDRSPNPPLYVQQQTSWYATLGKMPWPKSVVAGADAITIYDLSGSEPVLWTTETFTGRTITSVKAMHGVIYIGTTTGLIKSDYAAGALGVSVAGLVNDNVNALAVHAYPDASLDDVSGLPVTTVAVGTNAGVNILHGYRTIVFVGWSNETIVGSLSFDAEGRLWVVHGAALGTYQSYVRVFDVLPTSDLALGNGSSATSDDFLMVAGSGGNRDLPASNGGVITSVFKVSSGGVIGNNKGGLTRVLLGSTAESSMVAHATTEYATGLMTKDTALATFCERTGDDLVGLGELLTNYDFAADLSSWPETGSSGVVTWHASGAALIGDGDGVNNTVFGNTISTVIGETYVIQFDIDDASSGAGIRYYVDGVTDAVYYTDSFSMAFVATATSTTVRAYRFRDHTGQTFVNSISAKRAAPDRSLNNKGLVIHGTVPQDADGWFGPFSATDYMEQPNNTDLDFGTGGHHIRLEALPLDNVSQARVIQRSDGGALIGGAGAWALLVLNGRWYLQTKLGLDDTGVSVVVGKVTIIDITRTGFYIDGELVLALTKNYDFAGSSSSILRIGQGVYNGALESPFNGKLRRASLAPDTPSHDQIKAMTRFDPDAIPGTSDAVLDLYYNASTGLTKCVTADRIFEFTPDMKIVSDVPNTSGVTQTVSDGIFEIEG